VRTTEKHNQHINETQGLNSQGLTS